MIAARMGGAQLPYSHSHNPQHHPGQLPPANQRHHQPPPPQQQQYAPHAHHPAPNGLHYYGATNNPGKSAGYGMLYAALPQAEEPQHMNASAQQQQQQQPMPAQQHRQLPANFRSTSSSISDDFMSMSTASSGSSWLSSAAPEFLPSLQHRPGLNSAPLPIAAKGQTSQQSAPYYDVTVATGSVSTSTSPVPISAYHPLAAASAQAPQPFRPINTTTSKPLGPLPQPVPIRQQQVPPPPPPPHPTSVPVTVEMPVPTADWFLRPDIDALDFDTLSLPGSDLGDDEECEGEVALTHRQILHALPQWLCAEVCNINRKKTRRGCRGHRKNRNKRREETGSAATAAAAAATAASSSMASSMASGSAIMAATVANITAWSAAASSRGHPAGAMNLSASYPY